MEELVQAELRRRAGYDLTDDELRRLNEVYDDPSQRHALRAAADAAV